jgi:hypothetical protein
VNETGNTSEGSLAGHNINGIHDVACLMEIFYQDWIGVPLDFWREWAIRAQTESDNPLELLKIFRHLYLPAVRGVFERYKAGQQVEIKGGTFQIHHDKPHVPHGAPELIGRVKQVVGPIIIPAPQEE